VAKFFTDLQPAVSDHSIDPDGSVCLDPRQRVLGVVEDYHVVLLVGLRAGDTLALARVAIASVTLGVSGIRRACTVVDTSPVVPLRVVRHGEGYATR